DGARGVGILGRDAHLGAHVRPHPERPQRDAEVLLRLAVPVRGGGVEVVGARLQRARDRALALRLSPAHDQAADVATAESKHADLQARAPERSLLHADSPPGARYYYA